MAPKANTPAPENTENTENTDAQTPDPVDQLPNITISGSVSAVLSEAVESYRWQNRKSRAAVLEEALTSWAKEQGSLLEDSRKRLASKIEAQG